MHRNPRTPSAYDRSTSLTGPPMTTEILNPEHVVWLLASTGDHQGAIDLLESNITEPGALWTLLRLLADHQDVLAATSAFQRYRGQVGSTDRNDAERGLLYLQGRNRDIISRALQDPKNLDALDDLALASYLLKRYKRAEDAATRAMHLSPNPWRQGLCELTRLHRGERSSYDNLLRIVNDHPNDPTLLRYLAFAAEKVRDKATMVDARRRLALQQTWSKMSWERYLVKVARCRLDLSSAVADAEEHVPWLPTLPYWRARLVVLEDDRGQEVCDYLRQAIRNTPKDLRPRILFSFVLMDQRRYHEVLRFLLRRGEYRNCK